MVYCIFLQLNPCHNSTNSLWSWSIQFRLLLSLPLIESSASNILNTQANYGQFIWTFALYIVGYLWLIGPQMWQLLQLMIWRRIDRFGVHRRHQKTLAMKLRGLWRSTITHKPWSWYHRWGWPSTMEIISLSLRCYRGNLLLPLKSTVSIVHIFSYVHRLILIHKIDNNLSLRI